MQSDAAIPPSFTSASPSREISVLRLTPHFYWPQLERSGWPVQFDAIGGMQTQIFGQTVALAAAGVRQQVLTLRVPPAPTEWQYDAKTLIKGVRVPVLPLRSRLRGMMDLNISWLLGIAAAWKKLRDPFNIVHVHWSGVSIPPLLTWVIKKLCRAKVVVTVHCSALVTYHPMSTFDKLLYRLSCALERRALTAADHVTVLTPRLVPQLEGHGLQLKGKVSVVPDAIDIDEFVGNVTPAATAQFKERFGIPADRRVIGYIGRVAREKGWRTLLDVAALLNERTMHVVVCGDGNERDLMEDEVRRRGMAHRFTITGYLPHREVAVALSACDVMLLTSRHEEFGSVMLEAMAVGTPVVAFRVGGVPHVLADGEAGVLVESGATPVMAEAVRTLLDSPETCARLRAAGRKQVEQNFGRAASTNRMLEVYMSLLEEREPVPKS